jgi:hypothetical protein
LALLDDFKQKHAQNFPRIGFSSVNSGAGARNHCTSAHPKEGRQHTQHFQPIKTRANKFLLTINTFLLTHPVLVWPGRKE